MSTNCILLMLLVFIHHAAGDLLQVSPTPIKMTRVLRNITGTTITACYMECEREKGCQSIAVTEGAANQLPTCHLLKKDNGQYDEGIVMTTLQEIGSGQTVNGQWGCWKDISPCSATCGGGYMNRTRECDSPMPQYGGVNCSGLAHRTVSCNTHTCSVDGNWGAWTNASSCSVTCGEGIMNETRKCNSPEPKDGGNDCEGDDEKTISCNLQACPVHGEWGAWTVTSQCDAPCDGKTFSKTRKCNNPPPNHGGNDCAGHNKVSFPCYEKDCSVVNIALKKPATQSSTSFSATAAVDGNVDTYSMTRRTKNPWWQVDLQADVKVEYMIFRGDNDALLAGFYKNVDIHSKSSTDTDFRLCKKYAYLQHRVVQFTCYDTEKKIRYIKITLGEGLKYLIINELEFYARPT